jgi:hypothetical protein
MKARDERVALMNEARLLTIYPVLSNLLSLQILGGIRILKASKALRPEYPLCLLISLSQFMAWERNFEAKVDKIRVKELKFQKLNYSVEVRILSDPFYDL